LEAELFAEGGVGGAGRVLGVDGELEFAGRRLTCSHCLSGWCGRRELEKHHYGLTILLGSPFSVSSWIGMLLMIFVPDLIARIGGSLVLASVACH
jgi:hypothetical protein